MAGNSHRLGASRTRSKGFFTVYAFNLSTPNFFKPSLSFGQPQLFHAALDFIIERRDQSLSKLHAISQRSFIASALSCSRLELMPTRWQNHSKARPRL